LHKDEKKSSKIKKPFRVPVLKKNKMKKFLLPFPQYHSLREITGQAKYGSSRFVRQLADQVFWQFGICGGAAPNFTRPLFSSRPPLAERANSVRAIFRIHRQMGKRKF